MNKISAINKALGITRASKYFNKKTVCLFKHTHDSRVEADHCHSLFADLQQKRILGYKSQVGYELSAGIYHVVDFEVHHLDCTIEVRDVKAFRTDVWKMKYKMFLEKYSEIKYTIVDRKGKDNVWKLPKKMSRKMTKSSLKKSLKHVSTRPGT